MGQIKVSDVGSQQEALGSEVCDTGAEGETKGQLAPTEPFSTVLIRDEFLNHSYKYQDLLDRTLQQLESEFTPRTSSARRASHST